VADRQPGFGESASAALAVERWNGGTVERWNGGTVERWNGGTVERWNAKAEHRTTGRATAVNGRPKREGTGKRGNATIRMARRSASSGRCDGEEYPLLELAETLVRHGGSRSCRRHAVSVAPFTPRCPTGLCRTLSHERMLVFQLYRSIAPPLYRSTALPLYRSTAPPLHRSTAPPFYRTLAPPRVPRRSSSTKWALAGI
jgi:hypothetical protein